MPSFFGRKYMRGKPGRTERFVGMGILVALASLVGVFLLTGGLFKGFVEAHPLLLRARGVFGISEKPLFEADSSGMTRQAASQPLREHRAQLVSEPGPSLAANPEETNAKPQAAKPGAARFAEVPGGKLLPPTKVERYADNIYEKIDGKESAYRAFYVVDLKFGQYAEPDQQRSYDVYVYDMAAPANALGIYMSERAEGSPALPIGREGYASGTSVFFWKGQYYVNVLGPTDGGDAALNAAKQIAGAIAETIADAGESFWAEKLLPSENRVANSFSYQAISVLGYEFLQRVWFAKYDFGGKGLQLFVTRAVDAAAAKDVFGKFAEATGRFDKVLSRDAMDSGEMLVSETAMAGRPSKFGVAFHKGAYFGGVTACEDQPLARERAKALFDRLSASDPGDPEAVYRAPEPTKDPNTSEGSEQ